MTRDAATYIVSLSIVFAPALPLDALAHSDSHHAGQRATEQSKPVVPLYKYLRDHR